MITKQELLDFSYEFSLEAKMIEKDYILGWLLAGIGHHPALNKQWIFKGGTCLKR
jgi:predicted nucleotidyltransferase component of viral defense system